MSVPGYQCQKCWATFTCKREGGHPEEVEEVIECPTCHSTDVRHVDIPESWLNKTRSMCFG